MKNIQKYVYRSRQRELWMMIKKRIPVQDNEKCEACECTPCDCGWGNYLAKARRRENEIN